MKKILALLSSSLILVSCAQTQVVLDDEKIGTDELQVAVETAATKTFSFGTANYSLDYPSEWTYAVVDEKKTVFTTASGDTVMSIYWNWQGGMENPILSNQDRSIAKGSQSVLLHLSTFGETEATNASISLYPEGGTDWAQYSATIILGMTFVDEATVQKIFDSIR